MLPNLRRYALAFVAAWHYLIPLTQAATLPGNLGAAEIDRIVEVVVVGGATKVLRSAEPYTDFFPGLKLGLEFNVFFTQDLSNYGDQQGSVPSFIPMPRLYLSKSLFYGVEAIFSLLPSQFSLPVSSIGGMLKWSFYDEKENFMSAAAYLGYTSVSAFNSTLSGTDIELGGQISKDYVRFRPYLGAGILFASGSVDPSLVRSTDTTGASLATIHSFIGAEFVTAMNITLQLDLMNLSPRGSLFFGFKI